MIARTPRVTSAQAAECLHMARLAPPLPTASTADMPGALGLFRGKSVDYILTKAQYNQAGYPQLLHILMPAAPLRDLAGYLLALRPLALMDMPVFRTIKDNLLPFELQVPPPPDDGEQAEFLQDLVLFCQDQFGAIEQVLSGLIQGQPVAIINSPPSLDQRLRFMQGILALLPAPARAGITFTTHADDPAGLPVQVKFAGSVPHLPLEHVIYDWEQGQVLSGVAPHSYSRYIVAQLRLDPSLVVEQTGQLARTAVWRSRHKEDLGNALAWVSRRAAIDQTVLRGQPADRAMVAAVLREDPTLSPDLRLAYVRHLLALSLALDTTEMTDVIPQIAASNPEVAGTVAEQLRAAVGGGQAAIVFALLERWLLRMPESSAPQWRNVLYLAARQHLRELVENNALDEAAAFINRIRTAHPSLRLTSAIPMLLPVVQDAAREHSRMAHVLFVLSIEALPLGQFQQLLSDPAFIRQLPEGTRQAVRYLQPDPVSPAPPHVLTEGATSLDGQLRLLLIARLIEWALFMRRPQLVDTQALEALLDLTQTRYGPQFETLIQHVIDDFEDQALIRVLEPPGPRILIQLMLVTRRFGRAIQALEYYQNVVFRVENLDEFIRLVGEVFRLTPLHPDELNDALASLEGSQIRPEPRAMIYCGALINRKWTDDQHYAARRLTSMIFSDSALIENLGVDNVVALLRFHELRRNTLDSLRVGAALVDYVLTHEWQSLDILIRLWRHVSWVGGEAEGAALELLRRYLRGIPEDAVGTQLNRLRQSLGADVGDMLSATVLVRRIMGDMNFFEFYEALHIATELLVDLSIPYHTDKELPPRHRLRRDLDTMTGGLTEGERRRVAQNAYHIARQIVELAGLQSARRRDTDLARNQRLISEVVPPKNGVEFLRFLGGHLGGHVVQPLTLEREEMAHIFGSRSAAMFLRETTALTNLLEGLQQAFSSDRLVVVSPRALSAELQSLWDSLSLYQQRQIQTSFAHDCQQLASMIELLAADGNDRVLGSSGIGAQLELGERQPKNSLEALRWIHGYFARRHQRTRN